MHLASSKTSSGMPLSGAPMISFRTFPAFCRRSTESSLAVAEAMVPSNVTTLSSTANNPFLTFPSWDFDFRIRGSSFRDANSERRSASCDQIDYEDDHCDDQQNMYVPPQGVRTD